MKITLFIIILFPNLQARGQAGLHTDTGYFENGSIKEIKTFRKNTLLNHIIFNEAGMLLYQSPLLPAQKKPAFRFASGRVYFDQHLSDTIVFENNVPQLNLHFYLPGATVLRIDPYSYLIKAWNAQSGTGKGKLVIDIYEDAFTKPKSVVHKVVLVDIK